VIENFVIGLGQIGEPLQRILNCEGWDAKQGDWQWFDAVRYLHICFSCSDLFVPRVVSYAHLCCARNVIIHSTVMPGTTAKLQRELLPDAPVHCDAVYSPVRGRHGNMERDMRYFTKFVASPNRKAAAQAAANLADYGFRVEIHPDPTGLELSKLFQTTATAVQVAFAQEMARYCADLDVDFLESQALLDMPNLPHVIHQPGFIGGHCVMQNLDLLDGVLERALTRWIRISNNIREAERGREEERLYPIPWRQYV